jgi:hypothetical protein
MATRTKRPQQKDTPLPATPLGARQRALQEQERKLRERMEKYQKLIEEAPKLAAERAKEQREELISRAARTFKQPGGGNVLPDRRYGLDANVAAPAQQRRMRAERRQGRLMFFVLLLTLAASVGYLYYTITQG